MSLFLFVLFGICLCIVFVYFIIKALQTETFVKYCSYEEKFFILKTRLFGAYRVPVRRKKEIIYFDTSTEAHDYIKQFVNFQ